MGQGAISALWAEVFRGERTELKQLLVIQGVVKAGLSSMFDDQRRMVQRSAGYMYFL